MLLSCLPLCDHSALERRTGQGERSAATLPLRHKNTISNVHEGSSSLLGLRRVVNDRKPTLILVQIIGAVPGRRSIVMLHMRTVCRLSALSAIFGSRWSDRHTRASPSYPRTPLRDRQTRAQLLITCLAVDRHRHHIIPPVMAHRRRLGPRATFVSQVANV